MKKQHIPHKRIAERKKEGVHLAHHEHIGLNGKIAIFITRKFGSMGMFWSLVIWMLVWMFFATVGFSFFKYDKYPFVFLLFLSNLIQLWALPVLAVGQQISQKTADKQATQVYKDAEAILEIQDELSRLTKEIHKKLIK